MTFVKLVVGSGAICKHGRMKKTSALVAATAALALSLPALSFADGNVQRVSGENRYATAAAIQAQLLPGVKNVILATGENFPDALAAGATASAQGAAILLTSGKWISEEASSALGSIKPEKLTILGGPNALSDGVRLAARSASGVADANVVEVAGATRYETAAKLALDVFKTSETVYLASGTGFADALAGTALAAKSKAPVLLASPNDVPAVTLETIKSLGAKKVVILGGTSAVAASAETTLQANGLATERIAGANRYETAKKVLAAGWGEGYTGNVIYASGVKFADALAGGAAAGKMGLPMLLSGAQFTPVPSNNPGWVLGGPLAVADGAWSTGAPAAQPSPSATPSATPSPAAQPTVPAGGFKSCAEVRAAGYPTPIRRGDPGYNTRLDRDGDGLACEPKRN